MFSTWKIASAAVLLHVFEQSSHFIVVMSTSLNVGIILDFPVFLSITLI